eukprot:COSAG01_NODE_64693_length_275_cov_2.056818_1_plen_21_part_10
MMRPEVFREEELAPSPPCGGS